MLDLKATSRGFRCKLLIEHEWAVHPKRNSHFREKSALFRSTTTTTTTRLSATMNSNLLCPSNLRMMVSRNVFWCATWPRLMGMARIAAPTGPEWRCSANRLCSCRYKQPSHFGHFVVDLLRGQTSLFICSTGTPTIAVLRSDWSRPRLDLGQSKQRNATSLITNVQIATASETKRFCFITGKLWPFSWLLLWTLCEFPPFILLRNYSCVCNEY